MSDKAVYALWAVYFANIGVPFLIVFGQPVWGLTLIGLSAVFLIMAVRTPARQRKDISQRRMGVYYLGYVLILVGLNAYMIWYYLVRYRPLG